MNLIANYINIGYVTVKVRQRFIFQYCCCALRCWQCRYWKLYHVKATKGLCVFVCTTLILWRIDVTKDNETYLGPHMKGRTFVFENSLTCIFLAGFHKIVQNQISQNLSSRSWADTRGPTDGRTDRWKEGRRDLTKQIGAFRDQRNRA